MLQEDIFGETTLNGNIKSQLGSVMRSESVSSPKELLYKWAEIKHSLSSHEVDMIVNADRAARIIFNQAA
jgi:hypothetical protein